MDSIIKLAAEIVGIFIGLCLVLVAIIIGMVHYAVKGDKAMREIERQEYENMH